LEEEKKKVEQTQFIVATFRPELVKAAHKCYAISHSNKESFIKPISHDEAQQIIQEDQVGQTEQAEPEEEPEDDMDVSEMQE
jgi:hypothetical protein